MAERLRETQELLELAVASLDEFDVSTQGGMSTNDVLFTRHLVAVARTRAEGAIDDIKMVLCTVAVKV